MSYILDALKKAEQERGIGQVPRLASVQDEPPRPRGGLPWLIGGALLLNALVLAWWLRPVATIHGAPQPRLAPVARAPLTRAPAAPDGTNTMPKSAPRMAQATTAAPPPQPAAPAVTMPTPPSVTAVEPPISKRPAFAAREPARAASPQRELAVKTPEPSAASATVANSVPLLRDMPADFRASVPPLSLDVHVYAAANADRFVLINMKKYHEGEKLAEGPQLDEITPDGVILSYQGQQFRIARQ